VPPVSEDQKKLNQDELLHTELGAEKDGFHGCRDLFFAGESGPWRRG